jgi:hypothetical protein
MSGGNKEVIPDDKEVEEAYMSLVLTWRVGVWKCADGIFAAAHGYLTRVISMNCEQRTIGS